MFLSRLKILSNISLILVIALLTILTLLLINAAYPYRVLQVNNLPYPVLSPFVEPGKELVLHADYCKFMNVPAYFSVTYISIPGGALTFTQETLVSNAPVGCAEKDLHIAIPQEISEGRYRVELNVRYSVNEFRDVSYTLPSREFTVVKDQDASNSANIRQILMILQSADGIEYVYE